MRLAEAFVGPYPSPPWLLPPIPARLSTGVGPKGTHDKLTNVLQALCAGGGGSTQCLSPALSVLALPVVTRPQGSRSQASPRLEGMTASSARAEVKA